MRIGHHLAILISGFVWLLVGLFLLYKGLFYTVVSKLTYATGSFPLINLMTKVTKDPEVAILILVFLALILGLVKGRIALAKSAKRTVKRLLIIPAPLSLKDLFPISYVALVLGMMLLGMSLKIFKMPFDIRGFIDIAVGSGLINGAVVYFKLLGAIKRQYVRKK
ncbi:MAG: hypothetical protein S4CHLAM37_13060 [Chlamydiia bacterium]|nr:hypothetical protein [Chlamydiia bacterium]